MKPFLMHQGDVLLMSATIPETAVPVDHNGIAVLAHGETTGHSHHIYGPIAMFRDEGAGGGATYLKLVEPKALEHGTLGHPDTADHAALKLPVGNYEARRQVEWSDDMEPRKVID